MNAHLSFLAAIKRRTCDPDKMALARMRGFDGLAGVGSPCVLQGVGHIWPFVTYHGDRLKPGVLLPGDTLYFADQASFTDALAIAVAEAQQWCRSRNPLAAQCQDILASWRSSRFGGLAWHGTPSIHVAKPVIPFVWFTRDGFQPRLLLPDCSVRFLPVQPSLQIAISVACAEASPCTLPAPIGGDTFYVGPTLRLEDPRDFLWVSPRVTRHQGVASDKPYYVAELHAQPACASDTWLVDLSGPVDGASEAKDAALYRAFIWMLAPIEQEVPARVRVLNAVRALGYLRELGCPPDDDPAGARYLLDDQQARDLNRLLIGDSKLADALAAARESEWAAEHLLAARARADLLLAHAEQCTQPDGLHTAGADL